MNTRVWYLVGKKLSGEATEDQRKELSYLLFKNPDLAFYLEEITKWWQLAEELGPEEAGKAFEKELQRLEEAIGNPIRRLRKE
jgi:hypothetical protein